LPNDRTIAGVVAICKFVFFWFLFFILFYFIYFYEFLSYWTMDKVATVAFMKVGNDFQDKMMNDTIKYVKSVQ
jgi:hypothetical protein